MSEPQVDISLLEELEAILEGDFVVLIQTFVRDSARQLGEAEMALNSGDAGAVRKLMHSLKGSSANLGLLDVAAQCASLETTALTGQVVDMSALQSLQAARDEAVVFLQRYL